MQRSYILSVHCTFCKTIAGFLEFRIQLQSSSGFECSMQTLLLKWSSDFPWMNDWLINPVQTNLCMLNLSLLNWCIETWNLQSSTFLSILVHCIPDIWSWESIWYYTMRLKTNLRLIPSFLYIYFIRRHKLPRICFILCLNFWYNYPKLKNEV